MEREQKLRINIERENFTKDSILSKGKLLRCYHTQLERFTKWKIKYLYVV
jgi:hypothetical protein